MLSFLTDVDHIAFDSDLLGPRRPTQSPEIKKARCLGCPAANQEKKFQLLVAPSVITGLAAAAPLRVCGRAASQRAPELLNQNLHSNKTSR